MSVMDQLGNGGAGGRVKGVGSHTPGSRAGVLNGDRFSISGVEGGISWLRDRKCRIGMEMSQIRVTIARAL